MNAIARMPAVMSAIGVPFTPSGIRVSDKRSLMPAKITIASANPIAVEIAYTTDCNRLKSFWMTTMATPRMAQFVVIRGKNTPNA